MSKITFGEVDWNSTAGDSSSQKTSDYMKLEEGENVVRVMGNPIQYYVHWVTALDGSKKKIVSPIDNMSLVTKLEDAGFKKKATWMVRVLDRKDESFKLLEVGSQIYNGIRALYNNPKWGKVTDYDISIIRGPKGSQPLYSVQPNPKEKIDPSLKGKFVEFTSRVDVEKMTKPSDTQYVCEIMGWQASQFVSQASSPDSFTDDEFDFDEF